MVIWLLALLIFVSCTITVVTGATSLLVISLLLQFGLEPRSAIGLNMAVLAMMSVGGTIPFFGTPHIDWKRAPVDLPLTAAGSIAGALLVFAVPVAALRLVIPIAMLAVVGTVFIKPRQAQTRGHELAGHAAVLVLSVYGGFLSGGYVTLLMACGMYFYRYTFLETMATARMLNTVSSIVATIVFASRGAVDWKLAAILGPVGFVGAWVGTWAAKKVPEKALRRLFAAAVTVLAVKLLYDAV